MAGWAGAQAWHLHLGDPFSAGSLLKGLLLLAGATAVYQAAAAKGFSTLGLFPLFWLSLSRFQWDLCARTEIRYWLGPALFLAVEILVCLIPDGKKLLAALIPLWTAMAGISTFLLLMPLSFLTAPSSRFKKSAWAKWGGLGTAAVLFLVFQAWRGFSLDWMNLYDLFIDGRYLSFFLLGWLGLVAFPRKGMGRHLAFPLFGLTLGYLFWAGPSASALPETEILEWVLVFSAGFGLESFKRDLMDDSWHGRAVWVAVGVAFFGGVL